MSTQYTITVTATVTADEMPDPEDFALSILPIPADDLNMTIDDEYIEIDEA